MRRFSVSAAVAASVVTLYGVSAGMLGAMAQSLPAEQASSEQVPQDQTKTPSQEKPQVKVPAQATTTQQRLTEAEAAARAQAEASREAKKAAEDLADEGAAAQEEREAKEDKRPLDPLQEKIRRSERRAVFTPRAYTNDETEEELSPTQLLILDLLSRDSRPDPK